MSCILSSPHHDRSRNTITASNGRCENRWIISNRSSSNGCCIVDFLCCVCPTDAAGLILKSACVLGENTGKKLSTFCCGYASSLAPMMDTAPLKGATSTMPSNTMDCLCKHEHYDTSSIDIADISKITSSFFSPIQRQGSSSIVNERTFSVDGVKLETDCG